MARVSDQQSEDLAIGVQDQMIFQLTTYLAVTAGGFYGVLSGSTGLDFQ